MVAIAPKFSKDEYIDLDNESDDGVDPDEASDSRYAAVDPNAYVHNSCRSTILIEQGAR